MDTNMEKLDKMSGTELVEKIRTGLDIDKKRERIRAKIEKDRANGQIQEEYTPDNPTIDELNDRLVNEEYIKLKNKEIK